MINKQTFGTCKRPCRGPRPHFFTAAVAALMCLLRPAGAERDDPYEDLNRSWDRFGSVYRRVVEHYYAPVDHERVMRAAIEGMLRQLDAYSQYYDEEGLRQLRQDTTGKFAGLGITVGIMEGKPVVIAPIEGTPAARAGIEPGDLIVAIEGRETFGLSLEGVVSELRGEPGTSVRITIDRRGVQDNWDVVIVREVIKINSIAVADELLPGIGYISMRQTRFSEDTSAEMETALERLFASDITGLIIDLRGNPGGLLSQATEVADLFLPRGVPIVSVRERAGRNEETRVSQRRPPAERIPLVVLIDGGSASAAEIVAGAMQDNDRGLVVGTTSFGKGSVQTIFDLREDNKAALKLTTALYYTPSGRSIHRESLATTPDPGSKVLFGEVRLPAGQLLSLLLNAADTEAAEDQLRARFDLDSDLARQILTTPLSQLVGGSQQRSSSRQKPSQEAYHTGQGRDVHGGGGITPDIIVEADMPPAPILDLHRYRVFFDFVVEYVGDEGGSQQEFDVDDDMLQAFQDFVPRSAAAVARRDQLAAKLRSLRPLGSHSGWEPSVLSHIDSLLASIDRNADTMHLTAAMKPYVRAGLRRELSLRVDGRRASLLVDLDTDPQVMEAVSLLRDPDRFQHHLEGGEPTSD
jgi:carboxyl-terminal processing protease